MLLPQIRVAVGTVLAFILILATTASAEASPPVWKSLFDGKTLAGWHQVGDGEWKVEGGAIMGTTQEKAKLYGLLVSDEVFGDFQVRLKFKTIKGNSGFYIRTILEKPDRAHGLQIEVDPRQNSGGIYESYGRAWVMKPTAEEYARYIKLDDWNAMEISAFGGNVEVKVNGVVSAKLENDPSRPVGHLLMQMHAGNEMLVMFKDIEILAQPIAGSEKTAPTQPQKIMPGKGNALHLTARACRVVGSKLVYRPQWDALSCWTEQDRAEWDVEVAKAGTYDVVLDWSADPQHAGNPFVFTAGEASLAGTVESTGDWRFYRYEKIGEIQLAAGQQTMTFKPAGQLKPSTSLVDLHEIILVPVRQPARKK